MKFNDIRVSYKLWGTILGLLLILLAVAALSQYRAGAVMDTAMADVQRYENQITDAVRWQGMTETNTERSLAGIATGDATIEKFFTDRQNAGSAAISEVQTRVRELAVTEVDKAALAKVGEARSHLLDTLKRLPEVKASSDPDARRNFAMKEFLPTAVAYIDALKGFVKVQEEQREKAKVRAQEARRNTTLLALLSTITP